MGYKNAKDILPAHLLRELQRYAGGEIIYIPVSEKTVWGTKNGSRGRYDERNTDIRNLRSKGHSVNEIATAFYLSPESIKKIIK